MWILFYNYTVPIQHVYKWTFSYSPPKICNALFHKTFFEATHSHAGRNPWKNNLGRFTTLMVSWLYLNLTQLYQFHHVTDGFFKYTKSKLKFCKFIMHEMTYPSISVWFSVKTSPICRYCLCFFCTVIMNIVCILKRKLQRGWLRGRGQNTQVVACNETYV